MVIGYHVVFATYGFWLPNDPRGSWSEFVGKWELSLLGKATTCDARTSVAASPHNRHLREQGQAALAHPPVHLSEPQITAVGLGFQQAMMEGDYRVCACSILSQHVHMAILWHERSIGRLVGHFKTRAAQQLKQQKIWPDEERPVWAKNCWKVFVNSHEQMQRAIAYVEENPTKEGRPRQHWEFVTPPAY